MAAPTEKTTSNPYARYTLARLREKIAVVYLGAKSFASLTQAQQDDIDEKIDDATDRISAEAFDNGIFWRRTIAAGITMVLDQKTYEMPTDCKRIITMKETIGGKSRDVPWIEEHAYEKTWGEGLTLTHPLNTVNAAPFWMSRGFSTNNQLIIERSPTVGSPEAGGKLYPLYVPYDGNVSDGDTAILIPAARRAQVHYAKWMVAAGNSDADQVVINERLFRDEIAVLQQHEGSISEDAKVIGIDGTFVSELQANYPGRRIFNDAAT